MCIVIIPFLIYIIFVTILPSFIFFTCGWLTPRCRTCGKEGLMACTLPFRNSIMANEPLKGSRFFRPNFYEQRMLTVQCMHVWKCLHVTQHMQFLCTGNALKTIRWVTINKTRSLKLLQTHPTLSMHHHIKNHSTHFAEDWSLQGLQARVKHLTFFLPNGWRKCWGTQHPNHTGTELSACSLLRPPDCLFSPSSAPGPIFSVLFSC